MTKLTDGNRTVEIGMYVYEDNQMGCDWSADFYCVGILPKDRNNDAFIVEDVSYCIEQAEDWKYRCNDFNDDEPDDEIRIVEIYDC